MDLNLQIKLVILILEYCSQIVPSLVAIESHVSWRVSLSLIADDKK